MAEDPNKTTVYVDVEDDISTIIEKMEDAPKNVVALVLPKRSAVLQSTVNMRLLKQSAEKASKKIALVTSEDAIVALAGAVGLPVTRDLQTVPEIPESASAAEAAVEPGEDAPYGGDDAKEPAKQKEPDSKPIRKAASVGALAEAHERKEPETVELDDEPEGAETEHESGKVAPAAAGAAVSKMPKVKVPNFDRFRRRSLLIVGGLIGLIVLYFLAFNILPKATVAITTSSSPVSLNMNVSASGGAKKLDETNNIIPSSVQTYKQTAKKTVKATGQQNVGSKATGTVTMSTETNCISPVSNVPAGATLVSNSLNFVSQDDATFSHTSNDGLKCVWTSNPVSIVAASAGSNYNGSTSFTVSGYSGYSASGAATSGGSNKIITVISQQDLNNAVTAISQDSSQPTKAEGTKQFKQNLDSQGYYVVDSTVKASDPTPTSTPAVGQQASSAVVTVTTTYTALAVKKDDITKLIGDYANKQIDTSKQKIDTTDILSKATVDVATQTSPTDASLTIGGTVNAVPLLDSNLVKQQVAGKKKGDITAELSNSPGVKSVTINLSPFWVTKIPSSQGKIIVNIQAADGSN